jgi:hypothetical protein
MKKLILLLFPAFIWAIPVKAQWEVFDPTVYSQLILGQAESVAKYVEMIQNQVQQINTLTSQLNEFRHYEDLFGDPRSVVLSTINDLTGDLRRAEVGQNLDDLVALADGAQAMTDTASGLYHAIGISFSTPGGATVTRQRDEYKPYSAIHHTAQNYLTVADNAAARRAEIKTKIAETSDQIQSATTDAEVQKLTGVMIGLQADLSSVDHEMNQALASTLVQDIENRNDEKKQAQARRDQQHAEFTESLVKYGNTFKLMTAPSMFPVR